MARIGRPPEPVPTDVAESLLDWLHEGKSLLAWCRQPGRPKARTISDWKAKDPEFAAAFARAREAGAGLLIDLAQDVADDGRNDTYAAEDGEERVDHDVVARSKLRVDTLMKRAACYAPKLYGTKIQLGGDPDGVPIKVEAGPPPPVGLDDYLAALAATAKQLPAEHGDDEPDAC